MPPNESVPIIQHAVQLAIAPVFLLIGVAGLLGVMANRLARIVDRARDLEQKWAALYEKALAAAPVEIVNLEGKAQLSVGCESHPATFAPAGSNRNSRK